MFIVILLISLLHKDTKTIPYKQAFLYLFLNIFDYKSMSYNWLIVSSL